VLGTRLSGSAQLTQAPRAVSKWAPIAVIKNFTRFCHNRNLASSGRCQSASVIPIAAMLVLSACGTGEQLAAGPVVGYVRGRGWSAGWEAGGGPMETPSAGTDPVPTDSSLFSHFNVGMSWRPGASGTEGRERVTYAAWEPWLLLGGTFGVAHSSADGNFRPLLGVWEAAPYVHAIRATDTNQALWSCSPCYTISLAIGWRWAGSGEFYVAPKFGILNGVKMPYPFQKYHD
jgi:hypothetical protein